jgi:hypothetical protein
MLNGPRDTFPRVEVVEVIHNFFQMFFDYKKFGFSSTTSTP